MHSLDSSTRVQTHTHWFLCFHTTVLWHGVSGKKRRGGVHQFGDCSPAQPSPAFIHLYLSVPAAALLLVLSCSFLIGSSRWKGCVPSLFPPPHSPSYIPILLSRYLRVSSVLSVQQRFFFFLLTGYDLRCCMYMYAYHGIE